MLLGQSVASSSIPLVVPAKQGRVCTAWTSAKWQVRAQVVYENRKGKGSAQTCRLLRGPGEGRAQAEQHVVAGPRGAEADNEDPNGRQGLYARQVRQQHQVQVRHLPGDRQQLICIGLKTLKNFGLNILRSFTKFRHFAEQESGCLCGF